MTEKKYSEEEMNSVVDKLCKVIKDQKERFEKNLTEVLKNDG